MERIYRAKNGVVERTRFYVGDTAQPRTGKKSASTPRKQEANKNRAAHVLGRILNNNFSQGDLQIELTFDERSFRSLRSAAYRKLDKGAKAKKEIKRNAVWAEAKKEGEAFIRRLRKAGASELRYVMVPSDMDGSTGEEVRAHVHLVISGDCFEVREKKLTLGGLTLEEIWGKGLVLYEFLRAGSYNRLAAYLLRQTRELANRKKYTCSRNLEQIQPEEYVTSETPSEDFPTPKGYRREEWQGSDGPRRSMQYARYVPEPGVQPEKRPRRRKGGGT